VKSTATISPMQGRRLGTYFVRQPTLTSAHWPFDFTVMLLHPFSTTVPLKVQMRYASAETAPMKTMAIVKETMTVKLTT
jgi:hypothetical protein